jgi:multidrug efflux pump
VFKKDLSVIAFVGVILLVGPQEKRDHDGGFAVSAQRRRQGRFQAIHDACLVRFRPIMMTTMAALFRALHA